MARQFLRQSHAKTDVTQSDLLKVATLAQGLGGSQLRDVVTIAVARASKDASAALADDSISDEEVLKRHEASKVTFANLEEATLRLVKGMKDVEA
jgi:hypothetical protein